MCFVDFNVLRSPSNRNDALKPYYRSPGIKNLRTCSNLENHYQVLPKIQKNLVFHCFLNGSTLKYRIQWQLISDSYEKISALCLATDRGPLEHKGQGGNHTPPPPMSPIRGAYYDIIISSQPPGFYDLPTNLHNDGGQGKH